MASQEAWCKEEGWGPVLPGPLFPVCGILSHFMKSHFPLHLPKLALGTSQSIVSWPNPYHISGPQPNRKWAQTIIIGIALRWNFLIVHNQKCEHQHQFRREGGDLVCPLRVLLVYRISRRDTDMSLKTKLRESTCKGRYSGKNGQVST